MRWNGHLFFTRVAIVGGFVLLTAVSVAADPGAREADIQRLEAERYSLREAVRVDKTARPQQASPPVAGNASAADWNRSAFHLTAYVGAGNTDADNGMGAFSPVTFSPIHFLEYRGLVLLDAALAVEVEVDGARSTTLEFAA